MSKIQIALVGGIAVAGLGLSFILLPGDKELALINLKGGKFGDALASYEMQLQEKGPVMGVVIPLAQIYLHYGDIDKAIAAMELFVTGNPGDIEARKRLGLYYKDAFRREDYVGNLREISRLSSDEASLRELAEIYHADGRHKDRLPILQTLVDHHPSDPGDFLHLAGLEAAHGRLDEANTVLERLEKAFPGAFSPEAAALRVRLLMDTGKPGAALSWARTYVSKGHAPEEAILLAQIFISKGAHDQALALLEGFSSNPHAFPRLFAMIVQIEMARGRLQAALARLRGAFEARRLDGGGRELLIQLALRTGDQATAFAVAQNGNPKELRKSLMVDLATAGLESGNLSMVDQLMAKLGHGAFDEPILQSRLALAKGDEAAALEWAVAAERQPDLALNKRLTLATIYQRLGRDREALTILAALANADETPDWALTELASLYVRTDRATEGYLAFLALRERRRAPVAELGWALLATASGRPEEALNWLNKVGLGRLSGKELTTMYFVAVEFPSAPLILVLAEERYRREPDTLRQLMLAESLVVSGRPGEALTHLRPLVAKDKKDANLVSNYTSALAAALKKGAPVRDELRNVLAGRVAEPELDEARRMELVYGLLDIKAYQDALPWLKAWARRDGGKWFFGYMESLKKAGLKQEAVAFLLDELGRHDLTPKTQEERLTALLDLGGKAAALPHLKRFARDFGKEWGFAYADALTQLGRRADMVAFLTDYARRPGLDAEATREVAFRLLNAGAKQPSERLFRDLAADAAPDSKDVIQYLYLRGPRPGKVTIDWLETRARSANNQAERAAWARHLIYVGEAARAILVIADAPPRAGDKGPLLWVWIEALAVNRDRANLADVVDNELAATAEPQRIRRLGLVALEAGLTKQASAAYDRLLAVEPDDPEALRHAGRLAFLEGRYSAAGNRLQRYLNRKPDSTDYESLYYLAEIRHRNKQRNAARRLYERALRIVEGMPHPDVAMRETKARILHRLDRSREALALMEDFLEEKPGDPGIRAALARLLLESGHYQRARAVLSAS